MLLEATLWVAQWVLNAIHFLACGAYAHGFSNTEEFWAVFQMDQICMDL